MSEEEAIVGDAGLQAPPVAKLAGGPARTAVVTLTWPVEYAGQTYESVTIRRMIGTEVAEFARAAVAGESPRLPMFDVPHEVIDALDADDAAKVNEAVNDFLPLALRTADA